MKKLFLEKIVKKLFWKNISKTFFGKNICVLLRRANGGGLHTFGCFGNTSWPKHILRHEILKAWISCSSAFSHTPRLSLESLAIAILLSQDCSEQAPYYDLFFFQIHSDESTYEYLGPKLVVPMIY